MCDISLRLANSMSFVVHETYYILQLTRHQAGLEMWPTNNLSIITYQKLIVHLICAKIVTMMLRCICVCSYDVIVTECLDFVQLPRLQRRQ